MPVARVDGRLATGLERPDVFNWFTYVRDALVRLEPRAVVVSFGANDDHDYMTGIPPGVTIGPFGSSTWIDEYRRRVGGLMDEITAQGRFLVWVGAPIVRDAAESSALRAPEHDLQVGGREAAGAGSPSSTPTRCSRTRTGGTPTSSPTRAARSCACARSTASTMRAPAAT